MGHLPPHLPLLWSTWTLIPFPVYEESHYQATDNKTRLATRARISLEDISSAGWWLHWDTAAGVAQATKQANGHEHKCPVGRLSSISGLQWSLCL